MRIPRKPAPEPVAAPPLAERGRMLSADDVLAMLPRKPDGKPGKSRYWVLNEFIPEKKHKLGRTPYWWEYDLIAYLDRKESDAA